MEEQKQDPIAALGARLRRLRDSRSITQADLAARVGVDPADHQQLGAWRAGRARGSRCWPHPRSPTPLVARSTNWPAASRRLPPARGEATYWLDLEKVRAVRAAQTVEELAACCRFHPLIGVWVDPGDLLVPKPTWDREDQAAMTKMSGFLRDRRTRDRRRSFLLAMSTEGSASALAAASQPSA